MATQNLNIEDHTTDKSLKCRRCGRLLKNPESIELGFGVICYQKYQNRKKLIPLFTIPKKEGTEEVDAKTAKELTTKIGRLETKVKNLKKSNEVKEMVIDRLVRELIPDGKGAAALRTAKVRELMNETQETK